VNTRAFIYQMVCFSMGFAAAFWFDNTAATHTWMAASIVIAALSGKK
jgi:hypothetical protein